ncbi:hypothetical protein GGP41_004026 [Bipolaris sorokiniana]|uniref:Uncharacterized protein n=1 Tax=Cochliobolus sativus TaxID=45130 RepID=A0A8H5ZLQ4_COCSA|nr:hypothetical protein GGP41_004026 [Bipolaris sorokiniana]
MAAILTPGGVCESRWYLKTAAQQSVFTVAVLCSVHKVVKRSLWATMQGCMSTIMPITNLQPESEQEDQPGICLDILTQ